MFIIYLPAQPFLFSKLLLLPVPIASFSTGTAILSISDVPPACTTMSLDTKIIRAHTDLQYQQARQLIEIYAASRNFDAALAKVFHEMDHLREYYCVLLIAYHNGQPAGCVAIQELEPGICEMKRLFVLPDFRGFQIGSKLVERLIQEARELDYHLMRLDSHPGMLKAQELYQRFGFREIGRYNQNPIPGIRFFELQLSEGV